MHGNVAELHIRAKESEKHAEVGWHLVSHLQKQVTILKMIDMDIIYYIVECDRIYI